MGMIPFFHGGAAMAISDKWVEKGYEDGPSIEVESPVSYRYCRNKKGKNIGVIVCFGYLDEICFDIPFHGRIRFYRKYFDRSLPEVEGFRDYLKQYMSGKPERNNYRILHQFESDLFRSFARFSVTHFDDSNWDMGDE